MENKVYVVNREVVCSKKENLEKWWNNYFDEDVLNTASFSDNIACFSDLDKAKEFAHQEIEKLIRIYEPREHDINVYVKPIKVENRFELGNIAYINYDEMHLVYFNIDELVVQ